MISSEFSKICNYFLTLSQFKGLFKKSFEQTFFILILFRLINKICLHRNKSNERAKITKRKSNLNDITARERDY